MLTKLVEKTVGAIRETVDVVENVASATYDEVTSLPEAIEKGWNEGLFSKDEEVKASEDDKKDSEENPFK